MHFKIVSLYKFIELSDFRELQKPLLDIMHINEVKGTLLLSQEGINGTICGSVQGVNQILAQLYQDSRFQDICPTISFSKQQSFLRAKVKLKKEIVTMGISSVNPQKLSGKYVDPENWNQFIEDPEVLLVDTRNEYEIKTGTFKNAVNLHTQSFREFPHHADQYLQQYKKRKIAMFCTGGIRCEKATAYLKQQGFQKIYQLKGGILKYIQKNQQANNLFIGECFVFDQRITVNQKLEKGQYDQCYACRTPITSIDKKSKLYQPGISCPTCYDQLTSKQKQRFAERQKQMSLAQRRGIKHIG